jgi:hypothetical protein
MDVLVRGAGAGVRRAGRVPAARSGCASRPSTAPPPHGAAIRLPRAIATRPGGTADHRGAPSRLATSRATSAPATHPRQHHPPSETQPLPRYGAKRAAVKERGTNRQVAQAWTPTAGGAPSAPPPALPLRQDQSKSRVRRADHFCRRYEAVVSGSLHRPFVATAFCASSALAHDLSGSSSSSEGTALRAGFGVLGT